MRAGLRPTAKAVATPPDATAGAPALYPTASDWVEGETLATGQGSARRVAGLVTLTSLVLGYPVALDLSRRPRRAALLTVLLVLSLAISLVIRRIGWIILTAPRGTLALAAQVLGFRPEPFGILYSETAIVIGLTNVLLPFMVLSLHSALANIDSTLARAAADLGARPLRTLVTVTLPLSLPGVVAGDRGADQGGHRGFRDRHDDRRCRRPPHTRYPARLHGHPLYRGHQPD
jgi:ABC-type glycerol-3-phosphate transport system permease component